MILIVAAAILGAAAGLYVRPRLFALAVALSLSGAAHLLLTFLRDLAQKSPDHIETLRRLDMISGPDAHGIWPVMAGAGVGCLLAAVLWSVVRKQSTDRFWFYDVDGNRRQGIRSMDLVEEREVHSAAKQRMDALLGR